MKSLKEVLLEKLENANVARTAVEEYINDNYDIKGILTYENVNGIYVVNCNGNVEVKNKKIEKLTDGFVWGNVNGEFDCRRCLNLTSLEGAPKEVNKDFLCALCTHLTSLKGAPKRVDGEFNCSYCRGLKTLEGAPKKVGSFYCHYCDNLTSLEGAPKRGKIYCDERLKK